MNRSLAMIKEAIERIMQYNMKTIIIASDHAGFALKEKLKAYLLKKGF